MWEYFQEYGRYPSNWLPNPAAPIGGIFGGGADDAARLADDAARAAASARWKNVLNKQEIKEGVEELLEKERSILDEWPEQAARNTRNRIEEAIEESAEELRNARKRPPKE